MIWCWLFGCKTREVTIRWHDGGPHMEWWMCKRCNKLVDTADQIKNWPSFTIEIE